jgi:aryl-alcohol dehydrogenase-like predicted oxidoreductase
MLGVALGARRDEVVIATKFGMPIDDTHFGAQPAYVRSACEDSLRASAPTHIDLYQLHYPDDTVPIADTLGALRELVEAGKVREIGCSNLTVDQLREARPPPATDRPSSRCRTSTRCSSASPSATACSRPATALGLGFLPFYPLANGLLTGKVRPGEPIPEGRDSPRCRPSEARTGWARTCSRKVARCSTTPSRSTMPILSLAFSWLLSHDRRSRASSPGRPTPIRCAPTPNAVRRSSPTRSSRFRAA